MSISTYSELKTSIAGWLHRSDLTTSLADFITLSESKFNRRLRTLDQETTFGPSTPTSYEITRPSDFKAFIRLWRTSDGGEVFSRSLTEVVSGQAAGVSAYYAINRKVTALSDAAPTNWLLTAYPDLYLWAGLSEAAFYAKDLNAAAMWTERTDALIKEINGTSQRDKFSGPLRVTAR
jgi:hypothetical protein